MGVGLTGCATGFQADVSRFQAQLPAPQGQTFAVVADDASLAGGIEFGQYADLVSQELTQLGYARGNPETADLLVRFDYEVDNGRERIRSTGGGFRDPFYDPWYRYRRSFRSYGPWGYGFYDPWFSDRDVTSYTVYTSEIEVDIEDRLTGERLFEGTATAVSPSDRLQYLVPNLVDAMFTDFPGNSGETVRISIKPEER
ncbi:DUF4136 domain-containing protein [Alteriqipengyuania lutimaris]|uniref:DUF4136 domain-containing protein n=2 Tax=Alteriqipengyuania lutimaris TaxID=1538146 RepID=A0A395LHH8_9SPHN|nr:DUF4136 domain-containing protein [Alteriqipengyuania lutimaris]